MFDVTWDGLSAAESAAGRGHALPFVVFIVVQNTKLMFRSRARGFNVFNM